jgi:hypothetical protein
MGFIVVRPRGASDYEFRDYTRVSRYHGVDLGKSPRAHHARMGKRWLPVWPDREKAEAFAAELRQETTDPSWEAVEAEAVGPEGPLGPILIQLQRLSYEQTLSLEPLGRALLASAFPRAAGALTFGKIRSEDWQAYQQKKGGLDRWASEVAPLLTGLDGEQLAALGYVVVDWPSEETLVSFSPADLAQEEGEVAASSAAPVGV